MVCELKEDCAFTVIRKINVCAKSFCVTLIKCERRDPTPEEGARAAESAPEIQVTEPISAVAAQPVIEPVSALPAQPVTEPTSALPTQQATEKPFAKDQGEMNAFERSTLLWDKATFGILLVTCFFISLQWCEMRSGSQDTHDLAVAAGKEADRTKDVVDQMKLQAAAEHDLAVAAGKQADASKALAELTARQFSASQRLIESQRASISVAFASVLNPVTFHDGGLSFAFSTTMKNNGRLPANRVKVRYMSYFSKWGTNIFSEPMERQRDFCSHPMSRETPVSPSEN